MSLLIHLQTLDKTLNSSTNNPSIWGHSFLPYPIKPQMLERVMSFTLLPPREVVIINLVGLILGALMLLRVLKTLVMSPLLEGSILPNKDHMPYLIPVCLKWEDTLNFLIKWVRIPNRRCIRMWTTLNRKCRMVVLVWMQINICSTNLLRTQSLQKNFHF